MITNFDKLVSGGSFISLIENSGTTTQKVYVLYKDASYTFGNATQTVYFNGIASKTYNATKDDNKLSLISTPNVDTVINRVTVNNPTPSTGYTVSIEEYHCGFITQETYTTVVVANSTSVSEYGDVTSVLYINYIDTDGNKVSTKIDDKIEANVIFYKKDNLKIDFTKEISITYSPIYLTINNQVTNTTVNYTGDNPFTITLNANDGYIFTNSPVVTYTDEYGGENDDNMELSEDKKTATVTTSKIDIATLLINITGETEKGELLPTITNNIANTTATYSGSNHQYVITVKTNDGYLLEGSPESTYTGYSSASPVSVSLAVASDKKSASGVCPDVDENTPIILSGNTVTVDIPVTNTTYNCTPTTDIPTEYKQGDSINIVLTANDGYTFENATLAPRITYNDIYGGVAVALSTISEDYLTATINITLPTNYTVDYVNIMGGADVVAPVGVNYGAINVYTVTLQDLNTFASKRFFTQSGTFITYDEDLGTYVNKIKRLFIDVPSTATVRLWCGNFDTEIDCKAPDTDLITLDFGSVLIPYENASTMDYNSKIQLFVPFYGNVDIPTEYVNTEINLTCKINVVTGQGVMIIASDGVPFNYIDVEPSEDILYRTSDNDYTLIGGDKHNDKVLYGLEPYLTITYYDSINKDGRNNDYINAKLSDVKGFCVVDDVTLSTTAEMTADEQERIITLLKQGVYIEQ